MIEKAAKKASVYLSREDIFLVNQSTQARLNHSLSMDEDSEVDT